MTELLRVLWMTTATAGFWEFVDILRRSKKIEWIPGNTVHFFAATLPVLWMTLTQIYVSPVSIVNIGIIEIIYIELLYTRSLKIWGSLASLVVQTVIFLAMPIWHIQLTSTIAILVAECLALLFFYQKRHPVLAVIPLFIWMFIFNRTNFLHQLVDLIGLFLPLLVYTLESARRIRASYERNHDALTGLGNRLHFNEWIGESTETGMLILLDLDEFKYVNKTFGSDSGDELLLKVGERLQNAAVEPACVFRWGGDEFVIWIPGDFDHDRSLLEAQRIHREVTGERYPIASGIKVQASLGVSYGSRGLSRVLEVDAALLEGKRSGKDQVCLFDPLALGKEREQSDNTNLSLSWVSESLRFLMENSTKGFVLTDLHHVILDINPTFEKLSGYRKDDLVGHRPKMLASPSHYNYMRYDEMENSLRDLGWWKGTFINKRPDGQLWMAVDEISAVKVGDQVVGYWAMVERDVIFNMEEELLYALERNELQVYYQPKCTWDGRIVGAEALLRWKHPENGMISPGQFVSVAESNGLIVPIGYWVIQEVCSFSKRLQALDMQIPISVNVSPIQLKDPLFAEHISRIVQDQRVNPHFITLEITESALLKDAEDAIIKKLKLHEAGFKISLDDFGTGYSSLSYLKDLPFDEIKIDQAFVRDMEFNENSTIVLSSIISLAHSLKRSIVAEGVENKEQLDFLSNMGCEVFQGFYFAYPEHGDILVDKISKQMNA